MVPELNFLLLEREEGFEVSLDGDAATKARVPDLFWHRYLQNERNVPFEDHLPFGEELFRALFVTKSRREKLEALLEGEDPFVIRLSTENHFLHDLPWELLWRPGDQAPLLFNPQVSLVRSLPGERFSALAPAEPPYRLLIILSLPLPAYEKAPLDPLREVEKLYQALEPWLVRDLLKIEVTVKANVLDLQDLFVRKHFDILHFIGHGGPGGTLLLEGDPRKHPEPYRYESTISGGELASLFKRSGAKVLILNACHTASPEVGLFYFSPGLAQALHLSGLPLVVANQSTVADEKAIELTKHLYRSLLGEPEGDSWPLLHLLSRARPYLGHDFWRPVIFAKPGLSREILFKPPTKKSLPKRKALRRLLGLKHEAPFYVYRFRPLRELIHRLVHEERKLVVLHGLGGAGKSFLADYAADFLASEFPHVLALDMREFNNGQEIAAKVSEILAEEGIITPKQAKKIGQLGPQAFWREINQALGNLPWLLVLDNFEECQEKEIFRAGFVKDDFLREFLKVVQAERLPGRVVLTTRLLPYLDRGVRTPLETVVGIGAYDEGERHLLLNKIGQLLPDKTEAFGTLAEEIGWHPLALGLWLSRPMEAKRLLKRREMREVLDFYEDFFKSFPEASKALAFFPKPMSEEFLSKVLEEDPEAEELFANKLRILEGIKTEGDLYYRLYPILKLYFQGILSEKDPGLIRELFERFKDFEPQNLWDDLNLTHLLEEMCSYFGKTEEIESLLLKRYLTLASFWEATSRFEEAERFYLKALEIVSQTPGKELETATTYNNLALLYLKTGRFEKAERFYLKALEIFSQTPGKELETATTYNNLAGLYREMGRFKEAEKFYLKALEIREAKLGKDHPETATTYNNLAGLYGEMGRFEEAEKFYLKALKIREAKLGKDHPETATTYNNLALLYLKMGKFEEAEKFYLKALEIREAKLGRDHPETAITYNNLANLYLKTGKFEEAEKFYLKALEIYEAKLGKDHPLYFDTALALSNEARKLGHDQQAIKTLCEALKNLRYWEFRLISARKKGLKVDSLFQHFIHYALQFIVLGEALFDKLPEDCREDLELLKGKFAIPEILKEEIRRRLELGQGEGS